MANIGTIAIKGDKNGLPILRGRIACMLLETDIGIDPTGEVTKKGEPIFAVRLKTPSGKPFDAGTAYRNTISSGDNAGKVMWNIKIGRQPGIPTGLHLSAWPDGEGWALVDGGNQPAKPAATADAPSNGDVPF